jgi:hypothetical protein
MELGRRQLAEEIMCDLEQRSLRGVTTKGKKGLMKKLYIRFVLWLIGPAIRQELVRYRRLDERSFDERVRVSFSRYRLNGWARGSELESRQHFWRRIAEDLESVRPQKEFAQVRQPATETR